MIRLIQRRLIIPQGDTGTFTIPMQGTMESTDCAILAIYDPLTQKTMLNLPGFAENGIITFTFESAHTSNIEPSKRYLWDIVIYRGAQYNTETGKLDGQPISIDSYYAAFKLPVCEIRAVTPDVQK